MEGLAGLRVIGGRPDGAEQGCVEDDRGCERREQAPLRPQSIALYQYDLRREPTSSVPTDQHDVPVQTMPDTGPLLGGPPPAVDESPQAAPVQVPVEESGMVELLDVPSRGIAANTGEGT